MDRQSFKIQTKIYIFKKVNTKIWGAGIWIKGISIPKSSGGGGGFVAIDFSNVKRSAIIMAGVLITATSTILLAIIPKKYGHDEFIFKTYLAP